MAEHPDQPSQTSPEENEHAEVFSISQDKDGSWRFSRRDFLHFGVAAGGALLLKGICPRFGANSTSTQPVQQAGMMPLPKVYLHTGPSIDSNIVDTLQQNDIVLLIRDHADLGWVEVGTRTGQRGWLNRSSVDFTRAFTRSSQDFGSNSTQTPTPTLTPKPTTSRPIQLGGKAIRQEKNFVVGRAQSCSEVIQNGDFESGQVSWVEASSHAIITSAWADPYQGSWVAWLGGVDHALDKLTQLFHLPADVDDVQTLEFYLKVTTEETSLTTPYDSLILRFLDATGTPISSDISVADSTTPMDWSHQSIQLSGLSTFADQDIQIQFEATTDVSNITNFVLDAVSINLTCGTISPTPTQTETPTEIPTETPIAAYIYLPIIIANGPTPTPINTPTGIPTSTPCPSYSCTCHSGPCSCNSYPTGPTATFCACHFGPCSCNSYPTGPTATFCACHLAGPCTCNVLPCSCNIAPCTCDVFPCTCNAFPCTCNAFPCSCNIAPCTCNAFPCACNAFPCTCNAFPCSIT